jgi:hypothetical protein
MSSFELSQEIVDKYNEDGAVLIKSAFSKRKPACKEAFTRAISHCIMSSPLAILFWKRYWNLYLNNQHSDLEFVCLIGQGILTIGESSVQLTSLY